MECSQVMQEKHIHHLPIADESGALIGIISATDIFTAVEEWAGKRRNNVLGDGGCRPQRLRSCRSKNTTLYGRDASRDLRPGRKPRRRSKGPSARNTRRSVPGGRRRPPTGPLMRRTKANPRLWANGNLPAFNQFCPPLCGCSLQRIARRFGISRRIYQSGDRIFTSGPFPDGTNNVGEFLAIVHTLTWMEKHKSPLPVYSDFENGISWVYTRKCKTSLKHTAKNAPLFAMIHSAENWLAENEIDDDTVLKWDTVLWGGRRIWQEMRQ